MGSQRFRHDLVTETNIWKWQPTPVLLPGKSHGLRSLIGYSPWGHKELDTTERLHFHFSCLVLVSHWTWAAAGRGVAFSPQGNPKRDGGWRLLLTAFPQQGQVFYLDKRTVL